MFANEDVYLKKVLHHCLYFYVEYIVYCDNNVLLDLNEFEYV